MKSRDFNNKMIITSKPHLVLEIGFGAPTQLSKRHKTITEKRKTRSNIKEKEKVINR